MANLFIRSARFNVGNNPKKNRFPKLQELYHCTTISKWVDDVAPFYIALNKERTKKIYGFMLTLSDSHNYSEPEIGEIGRELATNAPEELDEKRAFKFDIDDKWGLMTLRDDAHFMIVWHSISGCSCFEGDTKVLIKDTINAFRRLFDMVDEQGKRAFWAFETFNSSEFACALEESSDPTIE